MRHVSILSILIFSFIAPCFSQGKKELANDDNVKITYTVTKKEVKLFIKTNGSSPRIEVDVNKNGFIDNMLDRSYALIGGQNMKLCTQYLIDETTSTTCGKSPSKAKLSGKEFDYVFTIPQNELTTPINPKIIAVSISIVNQSNGKWYRSFYPYGTRTFENVYEINVQ